MKYIDLFQCDIDGNMFSDVKIVVELGEATAKTISMMSGDMYNIYIKLSKDMSNTTTMSELAQFFLYTELSTLDWAYISVLNDNYIEEYTDYESKYYIKDTKFDKDSKTLTICI